jgi:cyclase
LVILRSDSKGASMTLSCRVICALIFLGAVSTQAAPLRIEQLAPDFRLEQLTSNVYAFISNNTTHFWEDGNTTLVVTKEGAIVIDAPSTYLSELHLAEIRKLTNVPVRYVINTHWHRDHVLGDHVYKTAFPSAQIVMQDYTSRMSDQRNPGILSRKFKGKDGSDLLANLKKAADTGIDDDGKKLTGPDLARARRSYDEFKPVLAAEVRAGAYVPADITFSDRMDIKLGGEEVQLRHSVGHTLGDTVAYLPREKIIVAGDLDIAPVPYGIDDMFEQFIQSLDVLIATPAVAIIPGHGEVQFSKEYLKLERDLLASLMAQAEAAVRKRLSLDEFKKAVNLSSFQAKLVGNDADKKWAWDTYFYDSAVERAFRIADGEI